MRFFSVSVIRRSISCAVNPPLTIFTWTQLIRRVITNIPRVPHVSPDVSMYGCHVIIVHSSYTGATHQQQEPEHHLKTQKRH